MSRVSKLALCLAAALVEGQDSCIGSTQCCEEKTKRFTPRRCDATPNCKWSDGGKGTWDVKGCWYHGESCFNCIPSNSSRSACSGSSYCSEYCYTNVPHFPSSGKPHCVENFPASQKQNGTCLAHECCGGGDGGVATEETPDVCSNTEYCKWYDGSQPDGVRGCIYHGPLCVFCEPPTEAVQRSPIGEPCEPGKNEGNATFCKTMCVTARTGPVLGRMVCRNAAKPHAERIVV